jgi:hypothetical protein
MNINLQEVYRKQLNEKLTRMGYSPGDLQYRWRTEKGLQFDYSEVEAAILDALVNMGGATAWSGDGASCAVQIVQNIIEERDALRKELEELKRYGTT